MRRNSAVKARTEINPPGRAGINGELDARASDGLARHRFTGNGRPLILGERTAASRVGLHATRHRSERTRFDMCGRQKPLRANDSPDTLQPFGGTLSPEEAEQCARSDAHGIIIDANTLALDLAAGERRIIVDGSQYAPSWRRLDGGTRVWENGDGDTVEAYTDELDRLIDDWSAPNGAYLTWDEGCLFVEREQGETYYPQSADAIGERTRTDFTALDARCFTYITHITREMYPSYAALCN